MSKPEWAGAGARRPGRGTALGSEGVRGSVQRRMITTASRRDPQGYQRDSQRVRPRDQRTLHRRAFPVPSPRWPPKRTVHGVASVLGEEEQKPVGLQQLNDDAIMGCIICIEAASEAGPSEYLSEPMFLPDLRETAAVPPIRARSLGPDDIKLFEMDQGDITREAGIQVSVI
ncbi:unnamed protein product [Boreogadus saida]